MIVSTHIQALLQEEGYEVLGIMATGEDAVEFCRHTTPDLILMDILLAGEINGIEATERIKMMIKTPVIFLTAMTDKLTLDKAKRTGPYSYVIKPFDERDLMTRIEIAMYKSNLEKESQLKRLATLIEGQEMERARISRDLHDGLGQLLNAIKFNIDSIDKESSSQLNTRLSKLIDDSVVEIRRISENLLPVRLQNSDLVTCLSSLCTNSSDENVEVTFQTQESLAEFSDQQKLMLYRITQEAIQNATKHGRSTRVFVQLYHDEEQVQLSIEDNGAGFDVAAIRDGHGLLNMRYRAEILMGHFMVESTPGKGTLIGVTIPLKITA